MFALKFNSNAVSADLIHKCYCGRMTEKLKTLLLKSNKLHNIRVISTNKLEHIRDIFLSFLIKRFKGELKILFYPTICFYHDD